MLFQLRNSKLIETSSLQATSNTPTFPILNRTLWTTAVSFFPLFVFHYLLIANPSSPTARGYYSYGRRDSATRTRFLLVRTSYEGGKEAFKRITLPGGSTVEELRKTVENAMKAGPVQSLMTLPDNV